MALGSGMLTLQSASTQHRPHLVITLKGFVVCLFVCSSYFGLIEFVAYLLRDLI